MRTECKEKSYEFQPLGSRAVVAGFDGGRITSDGGALLLRELEAKRRIIGQFAYEHRDQIGKLRDVAPTMFGPEGGLEQIAPTSMLVLTAIGALQLGLDFAQDAWPEVRDAVSECSSPPQASKLFGDMLRREGVDERAVRAIEDLGVVVDSRF